MTPNPTDRDGLVEALVQVLALLDKATPGDLLLATSCSWRRIQTTAGQRWLTPVVDHDGHPNMDTTENAEAAVAAVNFLRQYGRQAAAALREDARDAERYRWLRDRKNTDAVERLITATNWGDAYLLDGVELDAAIDAAMQTPSGDGGGG